MFMSKNQHNILTKQPVGSLLLKLALPTITAQLAGVLYNIVDRIYIGHIPEVGASALAGVGVCLPIIITALGGFLLIKLLAFLFMFIIIYYQIVYLK